jgi:hypothetical protein
MTREIPLSKIIYGENVRSERDEDIMELANIYLASVMQNKKTKNIMFITYILLAFIYFALEK